MPQPNLELLQKIRELRIASLDGEVTLYYHPTMPDAVEAISFEDGEIVAIKLADGTFLKRGMVIRVSSRYTGTGNAVIVGFQFGGTNLPILISMGGAEGELTACVSFGEITLFPKQTGRGDAVYIHTVHNAA